MRCDLPRDVCLKAEYKEMLTNAAAEVWARCAHELKARACARRRAHALLRIDTAGQLRVGLANLIEILAFRGT